MLKREPSFVILRNACVIPKTVHHTCVLMREKLKRERGCVRARQRLVRFAGHHSLVHVVRLIKQRPLNKFKLVWLHACKERICGECMWVTPPRDSGLPRVVADPTRNYARYLLHAGRYYRCASILPSLDFALCYPYLYTSTQIA